MSARIPSLLAAGAVTALACGSVASAAEAMDTARAPIASAPLSLGELSSDSLGVNRPQTAPTTNRKAKKNRDGSSAMGEMSRATSRSLTPLPPSSTMAAEIGPPAALTGHVSLAVSSDGLGGFGAAIAVAQARQN